MLTISKGKREDLNEINIKINGNEIILNNNNKINIRILVMKHYQWQKFISTEIFIVQKQKKDSWPRPSHKAFLVIPQIDKPK